jgi:hypothetical protein
VSVGPLVTLGAIVAPSETLHLLQSTVIVNMAAEPGCVVALLGEITKLKPEAWADNGVIRSPASANAATHDRVDLVARLPSTPSLFWSVFTVSLLADDAFV